MYLLNRVESDRLSYRLLFHRWSSCFSQYRCIFYLRLLSPIVCSISYRIRNNPSRAIILVVLFDIYSYTLPSSLVGESETQTNKRKDSKTEKNEELRKGRGEREGGRKEGALVTNRESLILLSF